MKTISIVIPVYNEEERLERTFEALSELQIPRGLKLEKIIFVNDGSDDHSNFLIQNSKRDLEKRFKVKTELISYKEHKGKGYAVSQGMKVSSSDYTIFCDADMSTSLSELKKFIPEVKRDIPIIIGTRKNGKSTVIIHQPIYRELLGRGFTRLSNIILQTDITDFTCGFKAFSRIAKNTIFPISTINGWGFDVECMYLAKRLGFQVTEIPVIWEDRFGSKVRLLKDLPKSFFDLFHIRFNTYHPQLLESRRAYSPLA